MKRVVGALASLALWALPAIAGDSYPAPAFFADGLTARSAWKEILARPGITGDFPLVDFGATLVPISALCADATVLRIADPRIDNGVAVAVEDVRPFLHAVVVRDDRLAAAGPAAGADRTRPAGLGYAVSVYKVVPRPLSVERFFLFDKAWEIPACPTR
jgi:hypothetical protein